MFKRFFKKNLHSPKKEGDFFWTIARLTGYKPKNLDLYQLALTHGSASYEIDGVKYNNERLEFLGDAIIGSIVAEYLYKNFPTQQEGELTKWRSAIIARKMINNVALHYKIPDLLKTANMRQNRPKSLFGNALEALVGALFLDHGYEAARHFYVHKAIVPFVNFDELSKAVHSFKSALIVWSQKNKKSIKFKTIAMKGKDHAKTFEVSLTLDGQLMATAEAKTKKQAEEAASAECYKKLGAYDNA